MDTMTVNQVRDLLVEKYPGRTINIDASCWYHRDTGDRETTFVATVFSEDGVIVEHRVEASQLSRLEDAVAAAVASLAAFVPVADEPAIATAEGGAEQ